MLGATLACPRLNEDVLRSPGQVLETHGGLVDVERLRRTVVDMVRFEFAIGEQNETSTIFGVDGAREYDFLGRECREFGEGDEDLELIAREGVGDRSEIANVIGGDGRVAFALTDDKLDPTVATLQPPVTHWRVCSDLRRLRHQRTGKT